MQKTKFKASQRYCVWLKDCLERFGSKTTKELKTKHCSECDNINRKSKKYTTNNDHEVSCYNFKYRYQ
jgi:hypothetical protein